MENANLKDNVNHPSHYTQGDIECIDAIKAATIDKSGIEAVYVSQVIKYVWRYTKKGGSESLRKASWYLNRLIKEVSDKETNMVYGCKKDASKESNVSIHRINKSIQTGLADKFGNHWEVID